MRVALLIDPGRARGWHFALVERLRRVGHDAVPVAAPAGQPPVAGLALLERFENLVYGPPPGAALGARVATGPRVAPGGLAGEVPRDAAVVIDLAGADLGGDLGGDTRWSWGGGAVVLRPLFDGLAVEEAALGALLEHRVPDLAVEVRGEADDGRASARSAAARPPVAYLSVGRPAVERPDVLTRAHATVAARMSGALAGLVAEIATGGVGPVLARGAPDAPATVAPAGGFAPARYAAANVARKVAGRLARLARRPDHWRVGWRPLPPGEGVLDRLAWPAQGYRRLPDDGARYYADPLLFAHAGVTYLFLEEYPYATGRGVIAVTTLPADGSDPPPPRTVLERPYHLSYPFVFAHGGEIWMMPETSANGTLELYRAEAFPDRWVLDRVLMSGVELADATPVAAAGRHWLMASVAGEGASSWDALTLLHGPTPLGPFAPLAVDEAGAPRPFVVDVGAARPAGPVVRRGGALWRPAQDCAAGYGAGLALCRIDRLDLGGYAQSLAAHLPPAPDWGMSGVHTLGADHGVEVIDALGPLARRGRAEMRVGGGPSD